MLRDTQKELDKTLKELTLMHLVLLKRKRRRKMIGLYTPLVNLKQKNLLIMIMMYLFLMLKLSMVMNTHLLIMMRFMKTLKQIIKNQTMMLKLNLLLILITHNPRINVMIREMLLLASMVNKENYGFKNTYLFLQTHPRKRMMRILSALLKCLHLSFCVCV